MHQNNYISGNLRQQIGVLTYLKTYQNGSPLRWTIGHTRWSPRWNHRKWRVVHFCGSWGECCLIVEPWFQISPCNTHSGMVVTLKIWLLSWLQVWQSWDRGTGVYGRFGLQLQWTLWLPVWGIPSSASLLSVGWMKTMPLGEVTFNLVTMATSSVPAPQTALVIPDGDGIISIMPVILSMVCHLEQLYHLWCNVNTMMNLQQQKRPITGLDLLLAYWMPVIRNELYLVGQTSDPASMTEDNTFIYYADSNASGSMWISNPNFEGWGRISGHAHVTTLSSIIRAGLWHKHSKDRIVNEVLDKTGGVMTHQKAMLVDIGSNEIDWCYHETTDTLHRGSGGGTKKLHNVKGTGQWLFML